MTITKVSYGRTYPLGNYASERIDMEATVDPEERIAGVIEQLKDMCDTEHRMNNPHLFPETQIMDYSNPPSTFTKNAGSDVLSMKYAPIEEPKISPEQEIEEVLAGIQAANNEKELYQWLFPSAKNIKTLGAYNKRKKQLNIA